MYCRCIPNASKHLRDLFECKNYGIFIFQFLCIKCEIFYEVSIGFRDLISLDSKIKASMQPYLSLLLQPPSDSQHSSSDIDVPRGSRGVERPRPLPPECRGGNGGRATVCECQAVPPHP